MYTIIGGDGKEYGPVTAEQVKAWIAAGRASPETRAKFLGTDEWKPLGEFPAFGGPGAEPAPPPPGPAPVSGDAAEIAGRLIAAAGRLDISSCYERSWILLKGNFWPLVGVTALAIMTELVVGMLPRVGMIDIVLSGAFKGGLYYYFLKMVRGQSATVSDAFAGFSLAFVPLMLAGVVIGCLTVVGLICLILPGIYLAVAYMFAYLLVIDRKMPFWTAMEVSRRVVTAQWWRVLGLALLAILFVLFGLAALLIGVFAALPLIEGAIVYAYEDLFNPPSPDIS